MNERQIKRIRKKFILLSTLSFFGVMLLMGGMIYLFSTVTLRNEVRHIMQFIVENDGELPEIHNSAEQTAENETASAHEQESADGETLPGTAQEDVSEDVRIEWSLRGIFGVSGLWGESPDYLYTIRYFAVLFDENENVEELKTAHIGYIDKETAEHYGRLALGRMLKFGSFGRYYYYSAERENGGSIVIYLDRTAQITTVSRILFAVLTLLGFGTLLAFFLMRIFSKRVVRTEVENAEKQKQFITNASHELKTPLAVIRANTEMQEMLDGETEWTRSTMRQADRMNALIQNLVSIARSAETETGELTDMNITPAVKESGESFLPVAAGESKTLTVTAEEEVWMKADDSRIRQLVSLLTDNAVKYCDEGGTVRILLEKCGKNVLLKVANTFKNGADVDTKRFFDRFYREDRARTIGTEQKSGKSGFGIGLSIAENLVSSLNGTIDASWADGEILFTCRFKAIKNKS